MRVDVAAHDDLVAVIRGAGGESIVVVILPGRDPLAQAQALAAIGPLTIERAPTMRVNAIVPLGDPGSAAVAAAAAFLDAARSTTGQVIEVS